MDNIAIVNGDAEPIIFEELSELDRLCIGAEGWSADAFRSEAAKPNGIVLCIREEKVIGLICGFYAADEAEITSVAVAPEMRRRGLGDALVKAFFAQLPDEVQSVFLEVRASNTPAQRLYRRNGFTQVGLRKRFYSEPEEDAVLMSSEFRVKSF